jgi:large subunit ribosomal protein L4
MAKISVLSLKGEKSSDLTLNKEIWDAEVNEVVLTDAINLTLASLRQGTHSTKTRGEVSGGGRKPWKQKGTGRARQGSTRAVQWPGGGIAFGPTPRSYDKKMNKKSRRLALISALSSKYQSKELVVVENFDLKTNKTKDLNEILKGLKVNGTALLVSVDENANLSLASRNNENLTSLNVDAINVLDIVRNNNLVIDKDSVKKLEEVLK